MAAIREHSIGELFRDLAGEVRSLFKEEIELARVELTDKASKAAKDAAALVGGGVLLFTGYLALVACAIAAISTALPVWLSALIIGAFFSISGVIVLALSINYAAKGKLKPNRTIDSMRKTRDSLKEDIPLVEDRSRQETQKPAAAMEAHAGPKSNGGKMDEIEHEMDATRSSMHRTINEIEEKLSPSHLAEEAGESIRKAASRLKTKMAPPAGGRTGKIASKAAAAIKKNTLPVFLTGVGISWLVTKAARHKKARGSF